RFWQHLEADDQLALAVSRSVQGVDGIVLGAEDVRSLVPNMQWGQVLSFDRLLFPRALMGDADAGRIFITDHLGSLLAQRRNTAPCAIVWTSFRHCWAMT